MKYKFKMDVQRGHSLKGVRAKKFAKTFQYSSSILLVTFLIKKPFQMDVVNQIP